MWLGPSVYAVAAVFTYYIKSGGGSTTRDYIILTHLSARDINQKKHQSGMNAS